MQDRNAAFVGSIPEYYHRHLGPVLFEPYAEDLVKRLEVPKGARVLEVACGTGIVTRRLRDRMPPPARLVATDLNEPMLAFAKETVGEDEGIEWRPADAGALPFGAAEFDAVVCQFGVMFVPDKAAAFSEARRVLKPGGAFHFNTWDRIEANDIPTVAHRVITRFFPEDPPQFYTIPFGFHDPAEIERLARRGGFKEIRLEAVALEASCPSTRHAAVGVVRGNPILNAIQDRGGVDPEEVIDAVEAALRERCGDAPMRARMRAFVGLARA